MGPGGSRAEAGPAVTTVATPPAERLTRQQANQAERRATPVKWWAAVGVIFLAIEFYVMGSWLTGGLVSTPDGPDPVPHFQNLIANAWQVGGIVALLAFVYFMLVRPWRREGRLTTNGLFTIVFMTIWWQDPLLNYFQHFMTYNTVLLNYGSWGADTPGWIAPRGEYFAEPIAWIGPIHVYVVCAFVFVGSALLGRARQRWPQMGKAGRVGLCFAFLTGFDLFFEPFMMLTGLYSFPGAIRSLSLFPGRYYQFPVYEALYWGATWTAWACVHHFRNDKGETLAERGASGLRVGPRASTAIRLLALIGICNLIYVVTYNVPHAITSLYADDWPAFVDTRSYLTDQLCGPGTGYACPGPDVPIPRRTSAHVDDDGRTLVPAGR